MQIRSGISNLHKMERKYIHRDITEAVKDAYNYFPVITITGPRQSGKTTLIRNLFPDSHYYSLENPNVLSVAKRDPVAFLNQNEDGMILDEVQNAPELMSYIQGIVDDKHDRRFVLSGSSNFALMKRITQSLAGRAALFELLPLSFNEIRSASDDRSLNQIIFDGFFPAVISGQNIADPLYPSYIRTYLDKDVRDFLLIKDIMRFHSFLKLCAERIGLPFNASELANMIGISSNTVTSWLSILQASYIVFLLPPYFEKSKKRLTKTPKLYFTDTGLACSLLGIEDSEQLGRDKARGSLFENMIVLEALKRRFNKGKESNLFFYRDSNQIEIDLLLNNPSGLSAIEIKSSMTFNTESEKTLKKTNDLLNTPVVEKAIVYAGDLENPGGDIKLLNYKNFNITKE